MIATWFKQHWGGISATSVAIVAIVTATLSFESRYASAEEVKKLKKDTETLLEKLQLENKKSIDILRQQQLDDKIFELNLKSNRSIIDEALLKRYQQQHKEVTNRLQR